MKQVVAPRTSSEKPRKQSERMRLVVAIVAKDLVGVLASSRVLQVDFIFLQCILGGLVVTSLPHVGQVRQQISLHSLALP